MDQEIRIVQLERQLRKLQAVLAALGIVALSAIAIGAAGVLKADGPERPAAPREQEPNRSGDEAFRGKLSILDQNDKEQITLKPNGDAAIKGKLELTGALTVKGQDVTKSLQDLDQRIKKLEGQKPPAPPAQLKIGFNDIEVTGKNHAGPGTYTYFGGNAGNTYLFTIPGKIKAAWWCPQDHWQYRGKLGHLSVEIPKVDGNQYSVWLSCLPDCKFKIRIVYVYE